MRIAHRQKNMLSVSVSPSECERIHGPITQSFKFELFEIGSGSNTKLDHAQCAAHKSTRHMQIGQSFSYSVGVSGYAFFQLQNAESQNSTN